ncbi:MAG: Hsp20/alpha crystallin family protein [bacterium]
MALLRYSPLNDPFALAEEVLRGWPRNAGAVESDVWTPRVDIHEDKDAVRLAADLPGIDPKAVEISIEDDVLTLKGERKRETRGEGNGFHRTERYFGSFERRFSLPQTVDREKIEASYKDGVLYLTLPKRDEVKPKKIQVAVS